MTDERIDTSAAAGPAQLAAAAELVERDAWLDFFDAAPAVVRSALGLASGRVGGVGLLASTAVPITELNRAMAVGVDAIAADECEAAIAWLDEHAAPGWALQIAPSALAVTADCVERHGLQPAGTGWAKFVQALPATTAGNPVTVALIELADDRIAQPFGRTVQRGFGLPEASDAWFAALVGRTGWSCFLATVDGEPAGAAATFVAGEAAWSGMSTTLPDYRGRGVQGGLIAARRHAASAAGAKLLTSETGHPATPDEAGFSSYRNQQRAGATEVYVRPNFKRPPIHS